MDIFDIYEIGTKCEYLRQCSPNVWREAEIIDVSRKNGITVKTDTGHVSTHSVDHVRLVAPIINPPNTACSGLCLLSLLNGSYPR